MTPEVIAEVSTNHGGHLSLAKEFVAAFAPHVDVVKFQLIRAKHLRTGDPQADWFRQAELSLDDFAELKAYADDMGVGFLLTVYNANDLWEVQELGLPGVKVGSGEAAEHTLAKGIMGRGLKALVSCGIHTAPETAFWRAEFKGSSTFLGCVTHYPAPGGLAAAVLLARPELSGWSDHAEGLDELRAAVVAGAAVLETHVQLPNQRRKVRSFEKSVADMKDLRAFCAEDPARFLGRWQV